VDHGQSTWPQPRHPVVQLLVPGYSTARLAEPATALDLQDHLPARQVLCHSKPMMEFSFSLQGLVESLLEQRYLAQCQLLELWLFASQNLP